MAHVVEVKFCACIRPTDDGNVVGMSDNYMTHRLTVDEYLASEETTQPQELRYGFLVREPSPNWDHQVRLSADDVLTPLAGLTG